MAKSKTRKKKPIASRPKAWAVNAAPTVDDIRSMLTAGDARGARNAAEVALATNPHDPAVLNVCGIAAAQMGDHAIAASMLETALAFDSSHLDARMNLANVLGAMGQFRAAETAYSRVIEAKSDHTDAHFNRALARQSLGHFADALTDFDTALEGRTDFPEAYAGRASVLRAVGRLSDAKANLDVALNLRPDWPEALTNRAALQHELGMLEAGKADLERALSINPNFVEAHYNLGVLLQEIGDFSAAIDAYRKALNNQPKHTGARMNLAWALHHLGDSVGAFRELDQACKDAPDFDKAHVNRADLMRCSGDAAGAVAIVCAYLDDHPGNPSMIAFLAIAEQSAGNTGAAQDVLALHDAIIPMQVDWPKSGAQPGVINVALANHVLGHPSLQDSPLSHATRHGGHTGNLMVEPLGPMVAFERAIRRAIDDYLRLQSMGSAHPFLAAPVPDATGLHVWGVAMRASGHQVSHNHPSAWLSGVYYVQTPTLGKGLGADDGVIDMVGFDDTPFAGWIEFGRPPEDFADASVSAVRVIKPQAGTMILFPSYLYHRTVPHAADDLRISIAFDVFPIN